MNVMPIVLFQSVPKNCSTNQDPKSQPKVQMERPKAVESKFVGGPKSGQQKNQESSTPLFSWAELEPYVKRHMGLKSQNADGWWQYDIGGDVGELEKGMSKEIDALVKKSLKDCGRFAPSFLPPMGPDVFQGIDVSEYNDQIRCTVSNRYWDKIKRNPQALSSLQFNIARNLRGKIRIKEFNLESVGCGLSSKKQILWSDIVPYIKSFLYFTTRETIHEDETISDEMMIYICIGNNNLSTIFDPKDIDWKVAEIVFSNMLSEISNETPFERRIKEFLVQAGKEVGYQEDRPQIEDPDKLKAMIKKREKQVEQMANLTYQKLFNDFAWTSTVKGFLSYAFEKEGLPPLVEK